MLGPLKSRARHHVPVTKNCVEEHLLGWMRACMQDTKDNHEEAANAAPLAMRLCHMVRD